ncbi:uncharacterized protein [Clytia hemisphaerica]|uniref:uncharacterized protein n=1 Tax=Clytia hemisphaerica TaxID=252671 RepID=UPI0034D39D4E
MIVKKLTGSEEVLQNGGVASADWDHNRQDPIKELKTPGYFTMVAPDIFINGTCDVTCNKVVSMHLNEWVEHIYYVGEDRVPNHPFLRFLLLNLKQRQKALDQGSFLVAQQLNDAHLTIEELRENLENDDQSVPRKIIKMGANIVNTHPYWMERKKELEAMMYYRRKEVGDLPAYFHTNSMAENHWRPLALLLSKYKAENSCVDQEAFYQQLLEDKRLLRKTVLENQHITTHYFAARTINYYNTVMRTLCNLTHFGSDLSLPKGADKSIPMVFSFLSNMPKLWKIVSTVWIRSYCENGEREWIPNKEGWAPPEGTRNPPEYDPLGVPILQTCNEENDLNELHTDITNMVAFILAMDIANCDCQALIDQDLLNLVKYICSYCCKGATTTEEFVTIYGELLHSSDISTTIKNVAQRLLMKVVGVVDVPAAAADFINTGGHLYHSTNLTQETWESPEDLKDEDEQFSDALAAFLNDDPDCPDFLKEIIYLSKLKYDKKQERERRRNRNRNDENQIQESQDVQLSQPASQDSQQSSQDSNYNDLRLGEALLRDIRLNNNVNFDSIIGEANLFDGGPEFDWNAYAKECFGSDDWPENTKTWLQDKYEEVEERIATHLNNYNLPVINLLYANPLQRVIIAMNLEKLLSVAAGTDNSEPLRLLVQGYGGTGKTFTINAITYITRRLFRRNGSTLNIAPTGAASNLIPDGRTLHSTTPIPFMTKRKEVLSTLQVIQ